MVFTATRSSLAIVVCALALTSHLPTTKAQQFENLGFDSASIVLVPGDGYRRVEFAPAFPSWNGLVGGVTPERALHNNVFLSTAAIGIEGSPGNYAALIEAGLNEGTSTLVSSSLSQAGLVPLSANSMHFRAQVYGSFQVSLQGQPLTLLQQGQDGHYVFYAADVSLFSGQIAELQFSSLPNPASNPHSHAYIDAITFSPLIVPEPSAITLAALGAVPLIFTRRKRKAP